MREACLCLQPSSLSWGPLQVQFMPDSPGRLQVSADADEHGRAAQTPALLA